MIDRQLVRYLANLSRLSLSEEEIPAYERQLSDILTLMEKLAEIDVSDVPETAQVLDVENVLRPDEPRPSSPRQEILANAPETRDGQFAVPKVIG
ncbi:MAG: Asp-tRNA(Asn)/Glu-tRNA(Gln) amidotransferase subunit GatC [Candidatus Riflebacteria bacterium]|nr:Asp-tRNA(Asn)/Glu-tRNA(Gln) amidotransferase subunit GatC [Candidatus Riflebacteria bacterium]